MNWITLFFLGSVFLNDPILKNVPHQVNEVNTLVTKTSEDWEKKIQAFTSDYKNKSIDEIMCAWNDIGNDFMIKMSFLKLLGPCVGEQEVDNAAKRAMGTLLHSFLANLKKYETTEALIASFEKSLPSDHCLTSFASLSTQ